MFRNLLIIFVALDLIWWVQARVWLIQTRQHRMWRVALTAFMVTMMTLPAIVLLDFMNHKALQLALPLVLGTACYLWHLLILPATFVLMFVGGAGELITRPLRRMFRRTSVRSITPTAVPPLTSPQTSNVPTPSKIAVSPPPASLISRRRLLGACAVAAPPMALVATVGFSLADLGRFRINRTTLAFSGWPRDLDGFTIAIVADIHAGLFTTQGMLEDIRNCTNTLRPDLILLPGDLINYSLGDLPNALDIVRGLFAPQGVYLVTGNHDIVQSEIAFVAAVKNAGIHILHDKSAVIRSPGKTPFELFGIRWSDEGKDGWDNSLRNVTRARYDPALFPILMAHHPHAWDSTPPFNIPLTLSGHTHGGQIMLTKNIGAGPIRFRYWSGVHTRQTEFGKSSLLISNGVGNWFPLRINAPPEIVHLTLRSAT